MRDFVLANLGREGRATIALVLAGDPSPRTRRIAALALLAAGVAAVSARYLLPGRLLFGSDLHGLYYPRAEILRGLLDAGSSLLGLWNPNQLGGAPLTGDLLDTPLYPPNLLWLVVPVPWAYELILTFHLALATAGTYRLGRALGFRRSAAVAGALAYGLSFGVLGRLAVGHAGHLAALAWTPVLLALLVRTSTRPTLVHAGVLALAGSLLLLSGHPQFVYHALLACLAFSVLILVRQARAKGPWQRTLACHLAAGVCALGLAAVHILPAAEIRPQATRSVSPDEQVHAELFSHGSLRPSDGLRLLVPAYPWTPDKAEAFRRGFWHERALYVGISSLVFAALALSRRGGPWTLFLAVLTGLFLLDAMGERSPVHGLAAAVLPFYGDFRMPGRSAWVAVLGLALLAAKGWDGLARGELTPRVLRTSAAAAGVGALLGAAGLFLYGVRAEIVPFVGLVAATAAVLGLAAAGRLRAALGVGLLLLLADLGFWPRYVIHAAPSGLYEERPWYLPHLGPDPGRYRVLDMDDYGMGPAARGVRLMRGYGYPIPRLTAEHYATAWTPPPPSNAAQLEVGRRVTRPEVLDALNVGWIVTTGEPPETGLELVASDGGRRLYRRSSAWPSARTDAGQDLVVRRTGGRLLIEGRLERPARVLIAESWMPGWTARLGGGAAAVVPSGKGGMAVEAGAGPLSLELRYAPAAARTGAWISAAFLAALVAAVGVGLWKRKGPPGGSPPDGPGNGG